MPRDFFDPSPEQQVIVLVDIVTLQQAERLIESCEHCNEENAEIPFDWILDRLTGSDSKVTDYGPLIVNTCLIRSHCRIMP